MKKGEICTPIPELVERLKSFHKNGMDYINTIYTLVDDIDAKSKYTHSHSARVRHYVELMGKKLNLPQDEINTLCIAATLHDIGRMGIDSAIWEKPGALTKEEYEIVKSYPEESADILASITFLETVTTIIRHHRENYNGTGYPDQLKREEIPLGSRILSVVDAFDAMTSERPYRDRIDPEVAIEELQNKIGTQFDPMIVETFISIWMQMYR